MNLKQELQQLRRQVAERTPSADVLHEVKAVRQDDGAGRRHWFRSPQRELLAGEQNGGWCWLEYSFPVQGQSWALRWHAGQQPGLWKVDRQVRHNRLNPGSEILQAVQQPMPEAEKELLNVVLARIPADLRELIIRLAAG